MSRRHIIVLILSALCGILCLLGGLFLADHRENTDTAEVSDHLCCVMAEHDAHMSALVTSVADTIASLWTAKTTPSQANAESSPDPYAHTFEVCQDLFNSLVANEDYTLYVFHGPDLILWHRPMLPQPDLSPADFDVPIMVTDNGWYFVRRVKMPQVNISVFALLRVWHTYPFANDYLTDGFHPSLNLPPSARLTPLAPSRFHFAASASLSTHSSGSYSPNIVVTDSHGCQLFGVELNAYGSSAAQTDLSAENIAVIALFVLALCCAILFTVVTTRWVVRAHGKVWGIVVSALLLIVTYFIDLMLPMPRVVSQLSLFSFQVFSYDWWLPSLAYVTLAAILSLVWALTIYRLLRPSVGCSVDSEERKFDDNNQAVPAVAGLKKSGQICLVVRSLVLSLLVAVVYLFTNAVMDLLVHHSSQLFFFMRSLDISFPSFAKIVIVSLSLLCTLLVIERVGAFWVFALSNARQSRIVLLAILLSLALVVGVAWLSFRPDMLYVIGGYVVAVGTILLMKRSAPRTMPFSQLVWIVALTSLFASLRLVALNEQKEMENRKLLAYNLSYQLLREDDPIAEQLLEHTQEDMLADSLLNVLAQDPKVSDDELYAYVRNRFFSGYYSRFDLQVIPCRGSNSTVQLTNTGEQFDCLSYFDQLTAQHGIRLQHANCFCRLIDDDARAGYLGSLRFGSSHLFVQIVAKAMSQNKGYPELLTNKRDMLDVDKFKDYSFAKYVNGTLALHYGAYDYPATLDLTALCQDSSLAVSSAASSSSLDSNLSDQSVTLVQRDYSHLICPPIQGQGVVLSYPVVTSTGLLSAYSFFFLFSLIISGIVLIIASLCGCRVVRCVGISERIHVVLVCMVLLLMVLVCAVSAWQTERQDLETKRAELSRVLNVVVASVNDQLPYVFDNVTDGGSDMSFFSIDIDNVLLRLSETIVADAHIFDSMGHLVGTSKRELFRSGLQAPLIDDQVLAQLHQSGGREVFVQEHIGLFSYFSIYVPIYDRSGSEVAYANVPFFADVTAMRRSMLQSLLPMMGSLLLIVLLTISFSYFLARGITLPLSQLRDSLCHIDLNKRNVHLNYRSDDEIGQLVRVYNNMTDELAASADKLAATERESTWRQMARQVAHEIKNPLTPMKLQVQYLLRIWREHPERFDAMFQKTSQTLIDQIDQLAEVASKFSDIAKMKKAEPQLIDLAQKVDASVQLFAQSENASVTYSGVPSGVWVMADPNLLLSVFNNLIKNALQSTHDGREVHIAVALAQDGQQVLVSVTDDGDGVPPDICNKIFKPNFTTKSQGMGLGLAIAKTIVLNSNGSIDFVTSHALAPNSLLPTPTGTSFTVTLPLAAAPHNAQDVGVIESPKDSNVS